VEEKHNAEVSVDKANRRGSPTAEAQEEKIAGRERRPTISGGLIGSVPNAS